MQSEKIPFIKKIKPRRRYQWLASKVKIDVVDGKFELLICRSNTKHWRKIIRAEYYSCPKKNVFVFRDVPRGLTTVYYFCEEQKLLCLANHDCDEWLIWQKFVFSRKGRYWYLFQMDTLQYLYLGLSKNGFWCSNTNFVFRKKMLLVYFLFEGELYFKIYRNLKKYRLQEQYAFERFDGLWDYVLELVSVPDLIRFGACRVFVEGSSFWKADCLNEQLARVRKGKKLSEKGKCFVAKASE